MPASGPVRATVRPRRAGDGAPASAPSVDVARMPSYQEAYELGRAAGFADGRDEGIARGVEEGRAQVVVDAAEQARAKEAADAQERATRDQRFASVAAQLDAQITAALDELVRRSSLAEAEVVELAVALATELVGRELSVLDAPAAGSLARALALAPEGAVLVARLHPDDAALAGWERPGLTVVADAGVEPGGCVLDAGSTTVDAQVRPALDRLAQVVDDLTGGGR